jgi:hypothetical protein
MLAPLPPLNNNNNNNENDMLLMPDDMTNLALWRERERRQRTVRMFLMFLFMLLLLDEEPDRRNQNQNHSHLRKSGKSGASFHRLEEHVFVSRRTQEQMLHEITRDHPRYQALMTLNQGRDWQDEVTDWAWQKSEFVKDEFVDEQEETKPKRKRNTRPDDEEEEDDDDPDNTRKVWHYPWNATGFYRGEWTRINTDKNQSQMMMLFMEENTDETMSDSQKRKLDPKKQQKKTTINSKKQKDDSTTTTLEEDRVPLEVKRQLFRRIQFGNHPIPGFDDINTTYTAVQLETPVLERLRQQQQQHGVSDIGVYLLPARIQLRDDNNLTKIRYDEMLVDHTDKNKIIRPDRSKPISSSSSKQRITLTRTHGRAAFQLFARSVPGITELSLVDGFVKLYDSTSPGYSTNKDILLRVRGVLLHSIGRLSLVSNADIATYALVMDPGKESETQPQMLRSMNKKKVDSTHKQRRRRRRLQQAVESTDGNNADMEQIRNDALALYDDDEEGKQSVGTRRPLLETLSVHDQQDIADFSGDDESNKETTVEDEREAEEVVTTQEDKVEVASGIPPWSNIVIPYPFVRDDKGESIRKARTQAARVMPSREQSLEANAYGCGFEINMDVAQVEWTIGEWRKLLNRRVEEIKRLDPNQQPKPEDEGENEQKEKGLRGASFTAPVRKIGRSKLIQDQALVMNMAGTIHSPNCNFTAYLNTTAIRTNWKATTDKAINYSFCMMLVCLTQILLLLRQLLHSQSQSAATRVSILCIGWQTIIDALSCLAHIYLSLAVQPLFTAFASVAFFKLLIFCVIEMKYMAIIIQARNSANGGQSTVVLRRQIAMLHLRFYVALLVIFLMMFYVTDKYRVYFMLALYSFWVPQIIRNVVTEARVPMHKYYIYGISLTRLVQPLYLFAYSRNFLKEVYPEAPTDPFACQMIVLWVAVQAAVLIAQGKYGARFMIPARFLPPKFDYSRPLPPSMLPPGAISMPTSEYMADRDDVLRSPPGSPKTSRVILDESSDDRSPTPLRQHQTAETTRNRYKGSRLNQQGSGMIEDHSLQSLNAGAASAPTLECSICYEPIDVRNRLKYMLAPCNHLFHKDCLRQWMDVKMECPVCRHELPSL